ncbi:MAG: NTP transferase domain-containing protein [Acidobacteriota bacterium]
MECVVLAGGRPLEGEPLWSETRGRRKALLDLAGRPMIRWVLDALSGSRFIDRVIVVGLDEPLRPADGVEFVPDQGSLIGNLYAGIGRVAAGRPAVYCWSDIPLVTTAMIDRFIEATADRDLDVNAGLVARSALLARYPDAEDLWLRLAEGRFIAADFGLFHPRHAARLRPHLEVLAPKRKNAISQALYVGFPVLARYLLGRLSMARLERHLERRFALRCHVRIVEDPELGLDVDGPVNLAICRQALERRPPPGSPGSPAR